MGLADSADPAAGRSRQYVIAQGALLFATGDGVVVVGERVVRIDFESRRFERDLVEMLRAGGDPSSLAGQHGDERVASALRTLVESRALVESDPPAVLVDLVGGTPAPASSLASTMRAARRAVIVARGGDERMVLYHEAAREAGAASALVWTTARSVAVAAERPETGPCALCALRFDVESFRQTVPETVARTVREASRSGAVAGDRASTMTASAIAAILVSSPEAWPEPGSARVVELDRWLVSLQRYPAHPRCACSARRRRSDVVVRNAAEAAGRRFSPLVCPAATDGASSARIWYPRSLGPWLCSAYDWGATTAAGHAAPERAFAEGVERFAMLHAQPDVRRRSASDLGRDALESRDIRSLLFRPDERRAPGFRFPDFDPGRPLDWSWIARATSGERRLVPTSLIGRVEAAGDRLVDATSNGYAAHIERDVAIRNALLELVERDAVLACWHLGLSAPRIIGSAAPGARDDGVEIVALLATWDVPLPVVWLVARLPDGSARSASAAGLSFESAWARATDELAATLLVQGKHAHADPADLNDPSSRHRPLDHLRYYAGAGRCGPLLARFEESGSITASELANRWPESREQAGMQGLIDALQNAGLEAWIADRSLPRLFGAEWHVARALVPDAIELSWGQPYRRLASARVARALSPGRTVSEWPHPIA